MSFFYDLNKKLNGIGTEQKKLAESKEAPKTPARQTLEQALRQDLTSLMEDGTGGANFSGSGSLEEKKGYSAKAARAGKDIGKPGKNFAKIEKSAAKKYGSKEAGERVAGAVLNKLRHPKESAEQAPTPSKGIPGNMPVPGKMDRLKGKRDYYEEDAEMMEYLKGKAKSKPYNGSPNAADAYNGMEFEGNEFTGKLKSTPKGGKFKVGGKEYTDTSELDEAVSRKHFQAIADTLKHIEDMNKRKELAQHHASAFKLANPRFDQDRFFKAAGITDEGIAGQAAGTLAGGALGGPVGAAIGGAIGNNLTGDGAVEEGFDDMDKWLAQREKEKGTGKFDKRKVSTGTVYTRKFNDEPEDDTDAPVSKGGAPRGRGRPAGTKRATGAKHSGRSKLASKDAIAEEGKVCEHCGQPMVAEKSVSQAQAHMMAGVAHNPKFAKKVGIKQSVGKEFNKADKGKDISKLPKKVKKTEEGAKPDFLDVDKDGNKKESFKKAVKDKKEKKVDETTTSGSVATSAPKASKSGGMSFGGGIYDSWNRTIESMISESVDVQMARHDIDGAEAEGELEIRASGAEADAIKDLLKNAGLINYDNDLRAQQGHEGDACGTCGGVPCQCDEMNDMEEGVKGAIAGAALGSAAGPLGAVAGGYAGDKIGDYVDDKLNSAPTTTTTSTDPTAPVADDSDEEIAEADAPVTQNSPDYPSNQEYDDDALQYSGGLNGKKSTGQSTIPVLASQDDRQVSEANSFLNLYKAFAKIVK